MSKIQTDEDVIKGIDACVNMKNLRAITNGRLGQADPDRTEAEMFNTPITKGTVELLLKKIQ